MSGSSYLSYGGILKVVRTDGSTLNNANAGVAATNDTSLKIKNNDDYEESYQTSTDFFWAAKNPGAWANGLKVCIIDNLADQRIGLNTTGFSNTDNLKLSVGMGVSHAVTGVLIGNGTTSEFTGHIRGIITGINTSSDGNSSIDVKVIS